MDTTIALTMDTVSYSNKPSGIEAKMIDSRLRSVRCTPDLFREAVTAGYTWCPATFNGKRSTEHFEQAQLVALDFDHGLDPTGAIAVCEANMIQPLLGYCTYSHHPENPRFRLVWMLDYPLDDTTTYRIAVQSLFSIFKSSADKQCLDPSRRFYGTCKGYFHFSAKATVSIERLVDAACEYIYETDQPHAAREVKKLAEKIGMPVVDNLPDLRLIEVKPQSYVIVSKIARSLADIADNRLDEGNQAYESATEEWNLHGREPIAGGQTANGPGRNITSSKLVNNVHPVYYTYRAYNDFTNIDVDPKATGRHKYTVPEAQRQQREEQARDTRIRNFDFESFNTNCLAFREHMNGVALPHEVSFGLLTSMQRVTGGEQVFMDGMAKRSEWQHDEGYRGKWTYQIKKIKAFDYLPQRCDNFCPYADMCNHNLNPIQQVPLKRGEIRRVEPPQSLRSLQSARDELKERFLEAVASDDSDVWVFKYPPGTGKTSVFTEFIKEAEKCIIAAPTHRLAKEIHDILKSKHSGRIFNYICELPEIDDAFNKLVESYYRIGAYQQASSAIWSKYNEVKQKIGTNLCSKEEEQLYKMVKAIEDLKTGVCTVMTHNRLAYNTETLPHNTLIVDEDIIPSLIQQDTVSLKDLLFVKSKAENCSQAVKSCLDIAVKAVLTADKGKLHTKITCSAAVIDELTQFIADEAFNISSDVLALLSADHWLVKDENGNEVVHCVRRLYLPEMKTIVFSATADKDLYELAFPGRVRFFDAGNIDPSGSIVQYPRRSYAKSYLKSEEMRAEVLAPVKDIIGDTPVITHKFLQDDPTLNIVQGLYFGNQLGSNMLENQDIAVLGTPHLNEVAYYLYAAALGINCSSLANNKMQYMPVRRNGYEFCFNTYEDKDLRAIQLWLIESELIQAVGRARTLSYERTVYLFSNLPLRGSELREFPKHDKSYDSHKEEASEQVVQSACL